MKKLVHKKKTKKKKQLFSKCLEPMRPTLLCLFIDEMCGDQLPILAIFGSQIIEKAGFLSCPKGMGLNEHFFGL